MEPECLYHIYNRGNNQETIFFEDRNYKFFLEKVKRHLLPHVDMLAYCLMPNHFHLMVHSKPEFVSVDFSNDFRIMLSSYTRAINKQENRTGSLFQQNSKFKPLDGSRSHTTIRGSLTSSDYPFTCFHYIHQNPLKAGLVKRMEDYEMSSFKEYISPGLNSICNQSLAQLLLDIPNDKREFYRESYMVRTV